MLEHTPFFTRLRLMILRALGRAPGDSPFGGPTDPHARVRVPRGGGRPERGAAVALAEPDDRAEVLEAVGGLHRR